jgi:hypothetical protein
MNTGICRVILAWKSLSCGASATGLGHSLGAVSSSSSARTVNLWVAYLNVDPGVGLEVVVRHDSQWLTTEPLKPSASPSMKDTCL